MGESWTKEGFIAELEARGEDAVWYDMATGVWGGPRDEKHRIAHEWYYGKVKERQDEQDRRREASQREQIEIACSAKDAAWEAAAAAREAAAAAREQARTAKHALITAIIALIIGSASMITAAYDKITALLRL